MNRAYAEVIGDPIAHSKSPLIHNFWLRTLGIDAEYRRCHLRDEQLEAYFANRRQDPHWLGCNVTVPHKESVNAWVDSLSSSAESIGAINTICRQNQSLIGENTDEVGFVEPLVPILGERANSGASALIIGAGGAARAVGVALWRQGYALTIANRSVDRARAVADHVARDRSNEIVTIRLDALSEKGFDRSVFYESRLALIVNASSLGMSDQPALDLSVGAVDRDVIVYDIVYAPLMTPLLRDAQACGMRTIDGLQMLVGQAAKAFTLFFGQSPPRQYDAELRTLLTQ